MIEVVSALIIKNGRVLLTQRPADKDQPFHWETPGGKVEGPHESHHSALQRELYEELGLERVSVAEQCWWSSEIAWNVIDRRTREDVPREVFLLIYPVLAYQGIPKPLEGQGLGWFGYNDISYLTLNLGNQKCAQMMIHEVMDRRLEIKS